MKRNPPTRQTFNVYTQPSWLPPEVPFHLVGTVEAPTATAALRLAALTWRAPVIERKESPQ